MTDLLARARFILGAVAVAGLIAFVAPAHAQQQGSPINPGASVMNEQTLLRQSSRIEGQIDQPDERARVLIQPAGRTWDHFDQVTLPWLGAITIFGTLAALAAGYFGLGRLRISAGRSGRKVLRFKAFERFAHWLTAVSFVVLGISGLNITFGKRLLLPLIGNDAFSAFSQASKYAHNYTSFPFVHKSRHAPARRFNAGEKLVFWGALGAGALVSASGFLLLFPFYLTDIAGMQIAQVVHSVIAMLFVALILGHIYIGTLGMEGAFEAMWTGEVDFNWAKEHHDLWLEQQLAKGQSAKLSQYPSTTPAE
jgi:formate dehydrogenase subunit gamma